MKGEQQLTALLATIRASAQERSRNKGEIPEGPPVPFITISRQAGAGAGSLAKALQERLSEIDRHPWNTWDRELVEKIGREPHISAAVIESLETDEPHPSWFADFLSGLGSAEPGSYLAEAHLFRRVASTVRALALMGRCILVGCGSVYATADLAGGVHLRLVAPLTHRIEYMARLQNISLKEAAMVVSRIDKHREAFHQRYWPEKALLPEIFTLTLNTAKIEEPRMVDCTVPLISVRQDPREMASCGPDLRHLGL